MATLELSLVQEDLPRLLRHPGLTRAARATAVRLVWHDTPDGTLAAHDRILAEQRGGWRIEALHPGPTVPPWPPGSPAPVLAENPSAAAFDPPLPTPLTPVAALTGHRREFSGPGEGVHLTILAGELRGVASHSASCRVWLDGPPEAIRGAALALAVPYRLQVPRAGLAAEAIAVARGQVAAPRHTGAPVLTAGLTLSDSIATITGQLLDAILHWSGTAGSGATPTPVHQMRVATRRLRSALSIFKHAAACPELAPLGGALKDLAAQLGAARDWDVFLDGTGRQIAEAFPEDRRVRSLLAAGRRRQAMAYTDLRAHLSGAAFRTLAIALSCAASLRPWETPGAETDLPHERSPLHEATAPFAAAVLSRRLRRVRHAGRGLATLPVEALHELRKDCKRLRYAAEFFQPLFPDKAGRRFVKHLAVLQEELGLLNDGAVAAGLMAHLGRAERSYAAGLVGGFVAAASGRGREGIAATWKSFRQQPPFWPTA